MSEEKKNPMIECRLCRKEYEFFPYTPHKRQIDDWRKVCTTCVSMWELGKKAQKASKSDGKDSYASVPSLVPINHKLGNADGPTEIKGLDIIAAMGGISTRGTEIGSRWAGGAGELTKIVEEQDSKDWMYIGGQSLPIKVPKARAVAMKKIISAFFNAITKAHIDGFNSGRSLLSGLASGQIKIEDYTEQADNARLGKKPKRRWE